MGSKHIPQPWTESKLETEAKPNHRLENFYEVGCTPRTTLNETGQEAR